MWMANAGWYLYSANRSQLKFHFAGFTNFCSQHTIYIHLSKFVPWVKGSNATFFLLQGLATRFVLNAAMENGGRFSDHQVDQLRRLGGWSPKSAIVHLYIKKIIEEYSDTLALVTPGGHGLISITFNFTVICEIDNSQQSCTLLSSSNVRTFSMTLEAVTVNFSQNFPFVMGFLFSIDHLNKHKVCFWINMVPWLLISIMHAISLLWHLQYLTSITEF